jgi:hypothetical protein
MSDYYILEGRTPVKVDSIREWAARFNEGSKRVAFTTVGDADVSTVFLGLDHSWGGGPPLLFETMVFGGQYDEEQWRYSTYDDALEGHLEIVKMVQEVAKRPEPKYPTKGFRVIRIRKRQDDGN